jgi:hypothetical protein
LPSGFVALVESEEALELLLPREASSVMEKFSDLLVKLHFSDQAAIVPQL